MKIPAINFYLYKTMPQKRNSILNQTPIPRAISFGAWRTNDPVYEVFPNGDVVKYENSKKVLRENSEMSHGGLYSVLSKNIKTSKGHVFCYGEDILKDDGSQEIDKNKRQAQMQRFSGRKKKIGGAIYEVLESGKLKKFDSVESLLLAYKNISIGYLNKQLKGEIKLCHGHYFSKGEGLVCKNEDGTITVNQEKIDKIAELVKSGQLKTVKEKDYQNGEIYLIQKKSLGYKKYPNILEASIAANTSINNAAEILAGSRKNQEYTFAYADDVEIMQGKRKKPSLELIKEVVENGYKGIYAINYKTGEYTKYSSLKEAKQALNPPKEGFETCLSGINRTSGDYTVIHGADVEYDNGEVNVEKIEEMVDDIRFEKRGSVEGVYAIERNGRYTKFPNAKTAAKALGVSRNNISTALNMGGAYTVGYYFVYEKDFEIRNEKGEMVPNVRKIDTLTRSFPNPKIYIINLETNEWQKYDSVKQASEDTGVDEYSFHAILRGAYKKTHGKYTARFDYDVESKNKEGIKEVDPVKILKAIKEAKSPKRRGGGWR